ncbi:MAG: GTP 3',8-cyclase MoaA [Deltaproteobacteria bacterium]|nr:GTP 3',8-cyclase MoaA [Deltaproteobacteria bacterium]
MSHPAAATALRDAFGRELRYLRLSVTERCNFRCVYCLPQGCDREQAERPLSLAEIGRLVDALAGLGFTKVRLTGGEPTLRPDLCDLVRRVAATPGIRRVGLTTNGMRLAELAPELRRAGLSSVNVSLDSLDPDRFREITGSSGFERVLSGIEAALAAPIPTVKVNAVLLRDVVDGELERFLAWTRHEPVAVRFIELMETADNRELFRERRLPAAELQARLLRLGWSELPRDPSDGPAATFGHPAHVGRVGLISAYARGFCDSCNRLRVSSAGDLRLCLFGDQTVPLRPLLADDSQREALAERIASAVARKPAAHQLAWGACGSASNLAVTGG